MVTTEQQAAGIAAQPEASVAAVDVEQLIRELDAGSGRFPEAAVWACQQHRDQVAPRLIQVLEEALRLGREGKTPEGSAAIFALMLLGEFETPAALSVLIELLRLPGELPFDLFGDSVTEDLQRILPTLAGDQLDVIDSLIADSHANEYVRWAAMSAYKYLVRDRRVTRHDAVKRLSGLLRQELDREGKKDEARCTVVTALVSTLVDLNANEAEALIDQAYELGLVEEFMIGDAKRIKAELLPEEPESCPLLARLGPTKITDAYEEMRKWNWQDDRDTDDDDESDDDGPDDESSLLGGGNFLDSPGWPSAWSP